MIWCEKWSKPNKDCSRMSVKQIIWGREATIDRGQGTTNVHSEARGAFCLKEDHEKCLSGLLFRTKNDFGKKWIECFKIESQSIENQGAEQQEELIMTLSSWTRKSWDSNNKRTSIGRTNLVKSSLAWLTCPRSITTDSSNSSSWSRTHQTWPNFLARWRTIV